ncbi:10255_t:CDS:2 [Scutellospora calospora]|uniref:10255_t:CDS:1 n=1 Tax=Scutellospora calospora TaxID=85575 RepID=A0ACA9KUT9_9GLOM|nr:10255_t:CDS:2 [Scutellospora calospora]
MSFSKLHEYDIKTCYSCQKCLFCFKDLKDNFCACDLTKKPSRTDTFPNRTIRAQVNWLKECDKFFGYESDFNKNFDLTLCSACNSKHDRGKSLYLDDQSNISISDQDDEIEIINLTELKVMLIIDTKKTNLPPGKWLVFTTEEVNNFYSFQLSLNCHIQKHLDIQFISNDDYELSYKTNGRKQAMFSDSESTTKKDSKSSKGFKKLKINHIPKEEDLNETEYNKAQHLQLNSARLLLWAHEIMNHLTTIDVLPTYLAFGMVHSIKPKIDDQTIQQTTTLLGSYPNMLPGSYSYMLPGSYHIPPGSYPYMPLGPYPYMQPGSYPYTTPISSYHQTPQTASKCNISLNKFFTELDKVYNGNGIYTSLEKSFEEQDIMVNSIKDLTDNQLIELGVSKVGWLINIRREAQKY